MRPAFAFLALAGALAACSGGSKKESTKAASEAPPEVSILLAKDGVMIDAPTKWNAYRFGIAETVAHEVPWFGEDCKSPKSICHELSGGETTLEQVHRIDDVANRSTLFDNHFGGQLTYYIQLADTCYVGGVEHDHYDDAGCIDLEITETVAPIQEGQREDTHWKASHKHHAKTKPKPEHTSKEHRAEQRKKHTPEAKECCKVCKHGKPCGNKCIPEKKECKSQGGCACYPPTGSKPNKAHKK